MLINLRINYRSHQFRPLTVLSIGADQIGIHDHILKQYNKTLRQSTGPSEIVVDGFNIHVGYARYYSFNGVNIMDNIKNPPIGILTVVPPELSSIRELLNKQGEIFPVKGKNYYRQFYEGKLEANNGMHNVVVV